MNTTELVGQADLQSLLLHHTIDRFNADYAAALDARDRDAHAHSIGPGDAVVNLRRVMALRMGKHPRAESDATGVPSDVVADRMAQKLIGRG